MAEKVLQEAEEELNCSISTESIVGETCTVVLQDAADFTREEPVVSSEID